MVIRRALVTGATGGLGRTLVAALLAQKYDVTATGRNHAIGSELTQMGARFAAANLEDDRLEPLINGADVIFHLAALSSPWGKQAAFTAINVDVTKRLLLAGRDVGCSAFIYASTPSIYTAPYDRISIDETSPTAWPFANIYAETKFIAEEAVIAANTADFRTIALRPRAIVGPHDTVLLPRIMRMAKRGRFPMPRGGRALIELTDVRDAAAAFIAADQHRNRAGGEAINITSGDPRPLHELLPLMFACAGLTVRTVPIPLRPAMAVAGLSERICALLPRYPEPPATRYSLMTLGYSQTFSLKKAKTMLEWHPLYHSEAMIAAALGKAS